MVLTLGGCSTSNSSTNMMNTVSTVASNEVANTTSNKSPSDNSSENISSLHKAITSKSQATKLVTALYSSILKSSPHLKITLGAVAESQNETIYQFHVTNGQTTTWVFVRNDGLIEDGTEQGGWVTPSQFFMRNRMTNENTFNPNRLLMVTENKVLY